MGMGTPVVKLTLGVSFNYSPFYLFIDQVLLMNPEFTDLASLASQLALGSPCLGLLSVGIIGSHFTCLTFTWVLGLSTLVVMLYPLRNLFNYVQILLLLGA